jgi:hypothetical protein
MTRRSRFAFVAILVIAAACSAGSPTEPTRTPNTMSPEALLDGVGDDSTCRAGYPVGNGKLC